MFNQDMLNKAEAIRCIRVQSLINEEFGFLDKNKQKVDFLAYFRTKALEKYEKWDCVYNHFEKFVGGKCTFGDVTVELCEKFRDYLLKCKQINHPNAYISRNSAAGYYSTFRALLKIAYKEKMLRENLNDFLEKIEWKEVKKEYLTLDEVKKLAATPCKIHNLKLTLNMAKTREFIAKVEGTEVPARLVIPKADKLLREFILDSSCRERILKAYLNMEENYQSEEEQVPQDENVITGEVQHVDIAVIKDNIRSILKTTLTAVLPQMRPVDEIIDSVFYVIDTPSIDSLDNVGMFIQRAFTNLYGKKATIVDKFVAFNLLVTKFEAYLKKLYYLMKGHEVPAQNPGEDVTWKNVIYAHKCLWNLKYSTDEGKQQLYQYLMLIKGWRNSESHISPTASEPEVDTAISIILTMYFYATGSSITDLEMNGHEIQKSASEENSYVHKVIQLHPYYNEENDDQQLVAEADVKDWPEEKRIATLKKSICQLIGYEPKKSPLSKQRHWIAIYRIAADKGFIIEGDFAYFKRIIDDMQISNLPVPLKINT